MFPELGAAGGVQRAGRLTAAVFASFAAARGEACVLLSLNDAASVHSLQVGEQEFSYTGFGRSKVRFIRAALRAAARQPTLVFALHPNLAPVVMAMKFCAPRTRTILFTHGIEVWTPLAGLRRWSLQRGGLVVAPSVYTAQNLQTQQGIAKEKICKLAWSLGPEFAPGKTSSATGRAPEGFPRGRIIMTVGRWDAAEAYKGVDTLIAAMPVLVAAVPDAQLVAVGGGSDLPRLKQLAQQNGMEKHIHFWPTLKLEELWSAYDFCDVFALPSRGEGFGLVFLEAMAHGKPVVGGAHGGTPDIIEDGVSGYLVEHGNVAQLTERLQRLLTDESLRSDMGTQALERIRRDYLFERFSAELEECVSNLLKR